MPGIKILVSTLALLFYFECSSQGIFNNWYFGYNAGVTFNTNPPSFLGGGQTMHMEGCASVSDNSGALLFYTDGIKVWTRNHLVMPNGSGLMGNWSSSQSALIVPKPGSTSIYYIFTVTDWMGNGDLRYSIVDMNLNSGNGDIIAGSKNILLSTNLTEKLVSATSSSCGVWVLTHQRDNNRFEARLVTGSGINNPVYSDAGTSHAFNTATNTTNATGVMKVSKNNLKIGLGTLGRIIELFDFDPSNGNVNNPVALPMPANRQGYGVCFSPDNSKFYITEGSSGSGGYDIFQFDLSSSIPTTIINSKTFVGRALMPTHIVGDLQIGPDNKIYFARSETTFIGVIPNPNLPAPACGFNNSGISLGTTSCRAGLVNEIRTGDGFLLDLGTDTTLCPGQQLTLTAPTAASYLWSTGATSQSIIVSSGGQYWLSASNGFCTDSDTIVVSFSTPAINLGSDTTVCSGQSVILNAGNASSYLWSTGATTSTINVTTPGQYWVKIGNGSCFNSDTINIAYTSFPNVYLGSDTTLCTGQSLLLNGGTAESYLWSTGAVSSNINVTTGGQYWVKSGNGNCYKSDTINVQFISPTTVFLGADTTLCTGQSVTLTAGPVGPYLWSTGATSQTLIISTGGQYWVKVGSGNCFSSDTINISFSQATTVSLGADTTLCEGQTIVLFGGSANTYLWSNGATSQSINVSVPGQYWVKTQIGNCFGNDTINISFNSYPGLDLGDDSTLCEGQTVTLNGSTADSHIWSQGSTTQTISVNSSGQYWVRAGNGNCFISDTINVNFVIKPIVNLGSDTTLCDGEIITLQGGIADSYLWSTGSTSQIINVTSGAHYWVRSGNAGCYMQDSILVSYKFPPISLFPGDTLVCGNSLNLMGATALSYQWSNGETTQSIVVTQPGTYSLELNYFNSCLSQYYINVTFENCDCIVKIPNAFTPNGDGLNDIFRPSLIRGCELKRLTIFNRYGQKVFETQDPGQGWDGKFSGYILSGVYVWMAEVITDGRSKVLKGTINLVR